MDPLTFLSKVLALHHPAKGAPANPPSSSSPPSPPHLQPQSSERMPPRAAAAATTLHPQPASAGAVAAHAAVLKLASEVLSQEPGLLEGAVETLDRASVRHIITRQYRRELHLVKGRDRLEYTVLGVRDCTCQSFQQMQHHSLNPRCKHLLAVRLAPFLDRLEELEVNDDLYESYVGLG